MCECVLALVCTLCVCVFFHLSFFLDLELKTCIFFSFSASCLPFPMYSQNTSTSIAGM